MTVEGLDALVILIIALGAMALVLWAVLSLRIQLTPFQGLFLGLFAFLLGMFAESWIRDTREQFLAGLLLVGMMVGWGFNRLRKRQRRRSGA